MKKNALTDLFASKFFLLIETGYLIFFPLLLLQFHPELFQFRVVVMIISLIYIAWVAQRQRISLQKMGFTRNIQRGVAISIPAVIIAAGLTLLAHQFVPIFFALVTFAKQVGKQSPIAFLIIYVLVSVPLQEIIFRGFYISRLELISKNKLFLALYSSVIFALVHLPFGNMSMLLPVFFLGLCLAYHFIHYRNISALMFIHALLGGFYIYLALFKSVK